MNHISKYEQFLNESTNGKSLICVDIQKEYAKFFGFEPEDFFKFLKSAIKKYDSVYYLYNGPDLGYGDENDLKSWMVEECGFREKDLDNLTFFDKGYGWFRSCMDRSDFSKDDIIKIVKFMIDNDLSDTEEITEDQWTELGVNSELKKWYETEPIYIPEDFAEFLKDIHTKIDCVGGKDEECIDEVEIMLSALSKSHSRIDEWVY